MVKSAEILSRYSSIPLYALNYHGLDPSFQKGFGVDIASIKIPSNLKSSRASKPAGIIVQINPNPRLVILNAKTHIPPLTTLFERGSDEVGLIGSLRFTGFIRYTIA